MNEQKIKKLESLYDQQIKQKESTKLTLQSIRDLIEKAQIEKQLLINEKMNDFELSKRVLIFWMKSTSQVNIIEVQLYENFYQNLQKEEEILDEKVLEVNSFLNEKGFEEMSIQKIKLILEGKVESKEIFYQIYHSGSFFNVGEKKELSDNQEENKEQKIEQKQKEESKEENKEEKERSLNQIENEEEKNVQKQVQKEETTDKNDENEEKLLIKQKNESEKVHNSEEDNVEVIFQKLKKRNFSKLTEKQISFLSLRMKKNIKKQDLEYFMENKQVDDERINVHEFQKWLSSKHNSPTQEEAQYSFLFSFLDKYLCKSIQSEQKFGHEKQKLKLDIKLGSHNWENMANLFFTLLMKGEQFQTEIDQLKKLNIFQDKQKILLIRVELDNPLILKQEIDSLIQSHQSNDFQINTRIVDDHEIIIIFKKVEQKVSLFKFLSKLQFSGNEIIEQKINEALNFKFSLSLNTETIQNSQKLLQYLFSGFKLSIAMEVHQMLFKNIKKNIEMNQGEKIICLLTLLQRLKIKLELKSILQMDRFLNKLGIQEIIKETPKICDILDSVKDFSLMNSNSFMNQIITRLFQQKSIRKLTFSCICQQSLLKFGINGKNIQRLNNPLGKEVIDSI